MVASKITGGHDKGNERYEDEFPAGKPVTYLIDTVFLTVYAMRVPSPLLHVQNN